MGNWILGALQRDWIPPHPATDKTTRLHRGPDLTTGVKYSPSVSTNITCCHPECLIRRNSPRSCGPSPCPSIYRFTNSSEILRLGLDVPECECVHIQTYVCVCVFLNYYLQLNRSEGQCALRGVNTITITASCCCGGAEEAGRGGRKRGRGGGGGG